MLAPSKPRWAILILPASLLGGIAVLSSAMAWSGWRINLTESEPLGLYRLTSLRGGATIRRNDLVEFCPPRWVTPRVFPFYLSGDCPGGGMPMLKTVAGLPGDRVVANLRGVWINGRKLPDSGQLLRSGKYPWLQLPHQQGVFTLGPRQYWVYGRGATPALAAQSFDSRYWGPIMVRQIRRIAN
ncbi:MAG: S26 family signal peptidase [Betaproteobacteria bacterium]|nr:S26 family signal peptidase [Betaproteobacteria bacterium]